MKALSKFLGCFGGARRVTQAAVAVAAVGMIATPAAKAWDEDFHFNITYIIARDAGIRDDVARYMAAHDVWTDESLVSGPFAFSKSRELWHFNGATMVKDTNTGDGAIATAVKGAISVSQPQSGVADAFFSDALRKGDLSTAFAEIHSGQDKEPHSRFYSRLGHPDQGHWPDRYWLTPEKFEKSVLQTYRMMLAVRKTLPPEALDMSKADSFAPSASEKNPDSAELMARHFIHNPEVSRIYHTNFLQHPEYVKNGLLFFFNDLKAKGVISQNVEPSTILPPGMVFDGTKDLQTVLHDIIVNGEFMKDNEGNPIFDVTKLMNHVFPEYKTFEDAERHEIENASREIVAERQAQGLAALNSAELAREAHDRGESKIATKIVSYLSKGTVPEAIGNGVNYVDMFEEARLRDMEMYLRLRDWRGVMKDKFGVSLLFEKKQLRSTGKVATVLSKITPKSKSSLLEKTNLDPRAEDPSIESVTLPWAARYRWVRTAISVLMTSMSQIHSPKFMNGCFDYQDPNKMDQMIASGEMKTYTMRQIEQEMGGGTLTHKMFFAVQNWLDGEPGQALNQLHPQAMTRLHGGMCKALFK